MHQCDGTAVINGAGTAHTFKAVKTYLESLNSKLLSHRVYFGFVLEAICNSFFTERPPTVVSIPINPNLTSWIDEVMHALSILCL